MRRFALVISLAAVSCNSVLGIPERELLVDEDAGADSPGDSTLDVTDSGMLELDTTVPDTSDPDTNVAETAGDTTPVDSADTAMPDTTFADAPDTALTDTPDTKLPDADAAADTKVPDAADAADTALPDTMVADTADGAVDAPACGVVGTPCCGGIPASCNTNAVCNSAKMCVAATGACVRSTDCPSAACGGPTGCGGNLCYACTPTFGAKAFGTACAADSECASGICDGFRDVCSGACSNGITSDADCKVYGAKAVCTELTYTSGALTGKIGFCATGCERDGDCATGKICRLSTNEDGNRLDLSCGPPGGATPYGSACTTGSDCPNGTCITFGGTKLCTPFCTTDADCPLTSAWKKCGPLTFARPKGGTQIVRACVP